MDLTKRCKERPQSVFTNQRRKPSNEYGRIVRIRRGQLLAIWANQISKNRPCLSVVLPRLLRDIVLLGMPVNLLRLRFFGGFSIRLRVDELR